MNWWKVKKKTSIETGACTDIGLVRTENQDAYGLFTRPDKADPEERLWIVADGMGGHTRGREASQTAVKIIRETYFKAPHEDVTLRLDKAFRAANHRIFELAKSGEPNEKMGTTCSALVMKNGELTLAHVGDSRIYRINQHGIEQLTNDHTLVNALRQEGVLTEEEARHHPRRNALTRAMGVDLALEADFQVLGSPAPKDCFLLCTDGIARISQQELQDIVLSHTPQQACEKLVALANDRGGSDNATVVLFCYT